ncbi:hypothetical protein U9M48_008260 [Paspalum notatum var. saurae]|uniref:Uncharacterized protein n=1 Tax=Paspalum notatum var. saurae TaxID=547442 RepID=A0AAQ3SPC6_PASNO
MSAFRSWPPDVVWPPIVFVASTLVLRASASPPPRPAAAPSAHPGRHSLPSIPAPPICPPPDPAASTAPHRRCPPPAPKPLRRRPWGGGSQTRHRHAPRPAPPAAPPHRRQLGPRQAPSRPARSAPALPSCPVRSTHPRTQPSWRHPTPRPDAAQPEPLRARRGPGRGRLPHCLLLASLASTLNGLVPLQTLALHEAVGHLVKVELRTCKVYRGSMDNYEDCRSCQMGSILFTAKGGKCGQWIAGAHPHQRKQKFFGFRKHVVPKMNWPWGTLWHAKALAEPNSSRSHTPIHICVAYGLTIRNSSKGICVTHF